MTNGRFDGWPAAGPAAVVLVAGTAVTAALLLRPASTDPDTLARRAEQDVAAGAFETAILRYQHLMALRPDRPEYALALADALDAKHRRAEAMAVLAAIAPADGDGYGPAHVRQAEWLVEAHVLGQGGAADLFGLARKHLNRTFADDAARRRAAELRAIVDAGEGRPTS